MVHSFEPGDASVEAGLSTVGIQPDRFVHYINSLSEKEKSNSEKPESLPELSITSEEEDSQAETKPETESLESEEKEEEEDTDENCDKPPADDILLHSISSLREIAQNETLSHKLSDAEGNITAQSVENALLVDARLRDPDGPFENGPDNFLTDDEREDANFLRDHIDELTGAKGVSVKKLGNFKNIKLPEEPEVAIGRAAAGTVVGSTVGKGLTKIAAAALCNALKAVIPDPTAIKKEGGLATNTSTLNPRDLQEAGESVFDRIDSNDDGYMSRRELANAVSKGEYTGQEAQTIASLYKNIEEIEELSNDEFGDENDGITRADLLKFEETNTYKEEISKDLRNADRFNNTRFGNIDSDNNGFLTEAEIDSALEAKDLSQTDKDFLERLNEDRETIQNAHDDVWYPWGESKGISKDDIKDFYDHWTKSGDEAKLVGSVSWMLHRTSMSQRPGISRDLYGQSTPLESIKPDAIDQGTIGDCYFLAALAAVAQQNPEQIQNMIKDNEDGTYTVTFPERPDEPVTVTAPTDAELGLYNGGSKYGVWVPVMEKAYGLYKQEHHRKGGLTPSGGADGGGWMGDALKTITGRDCKKYEINDESQSDLADLLEEAFTSEPKKEVTVNVRGSEVKGKGKTSVDGFASNHAYSIIGFNPNGADGGTVTVRNPWGNGRGTGGTIDISIEQFKRNFTHVVIAK